MALKVKMMTGVFMDIRGAVGDLVFAHMREEGKRFETVLMEEEEALFLEWFARWVRLIGMNPDPDWPGHFYDFRGAFVAGVSPRLEAPIVYILGVPIELEGKWHWPDRFKMVGHPTLGGGVEACHRGRFRMPKETPENKPFRMAYAFCDDAWRRLVWWKRKRWFKEAWPKGVCPHSAFMTFNLRRRLCGLPILEIPGKLRTIPSDRACPVAVKENRWGHWRHQDDFGWVKGEAGEGFEVGDPRGAYKKTFEDWILAAPIYGDRGPGEPPEMMTSRIFFRTNEGFMLNQDGEDGLWIDFAVEGMSVMLDGWLIAYCGDTVEGFECVQPCGPIDVIKQSWHDIIISQMVWSKTEFSGVALWDGMNFEEFMDKKNVEWRGYVKGRGVGLRADWPDDAGEAEYEELAGKTIYPAVAGWATGAVMLRALPGPNEGAEVPLAKIEDSDDVRFCFTVEEVKELELTSLKNGCVQIPPTAGWWSVNLVDEWWKVQTSDDVRLVWSCSGGYEEYAPSVGFMFDVPEWERVLSIHIEHEGFALGGIGDQENLLTGYIRDFEHWEWRKIFEQNAGGDVVSTWSNALVSDWYVKNGTMWIRVFGPEFEEENGRSMHTDCIKAWAGYRWHD